MFKFTGIYLNMDVFSIAQLSRFSGIKAHTIRIWEKRYNALNPLRSEGNTRYYTHLQLKRLLNIVTVITQDPHKKLNDVCTLSDTALEEEVASILLQDTEEPKANAFINTLIRDVLAFDEFTFKKNFDQAIATYGFQEVYIQVVYPLIIKLGILWATSKIQTSHEHFCTHIIIQKMYVLLDQIQETAHPTQTWILFLPENEFHEIGLLYASIQLKQSGHKVIYLGANIPISEVANCKDQINATHILTMLVHKESDEIVSQFSQELVDTFKGAKVLMAGSEDHLKNCPKEIIKITEAKDLSKFTN